MRHVLAASLGLAIFTACSGGGGGTTGTSTGALTTTTSGGTTGGLPAGAACSANAACDSDVCGIDGTGKCCSAKCSTVDPICGATACDSSGACTYASSGKTCPSVNCSQSLFVPQACDGQGTCAPGTPVACDGGFICQGSACKTSCNSIADCRVGLACNAGACVAPIATGPCTEDDDCTSQHCGVDGGAGHCCTSATSCVAGGSCGALDCDATTGACLYADAGIACGSGSQSCSGETLTPADACDGKGACNQPPTHDCAPYECGGNNACLAQCADNSACILNDFCDLTNQTCCGGLGAGSTIKVDSVTGSDQAACCGLGSNQPCLTIAQAMQSIDSAQASNAIIKATVNGAGGDWAPNGEIYPIVLGWGVELNAPGVYFYDPAGQAAEVIDIAAFSSHDVSGSATLVGSAALPVNVGFDSAGNQSPDGAAIKVEANETLNLANANLNGNAVGHTAALDIAAGGSVILGADPSLAVTGTVTIGNTFAKHASNGWNGILCETGPSSGCTVTDAKLATSSVIIEGQENNDIDAEDSASITLQSSPVVGLAPAGAGFGNCPSKPDADGIGLGSGEAILLRGTAHVTFENGKVQCIAAEGFHLSASKSGTPTLDLQGTTIQNTEYGIVAQAGTATVLNSTIQFNYTGVEQTSDATYIGSIVLSDADAGMNTVICSSENESVTTRVNPGVSVLNISNLALDADNVNWDTSGPDLFSCISLTSCTCKISSCSVTPGTDGMDAAYESGTISNANPGLSATTCTAGKAGGCGTDGNCTPPATCCVSLGQCLSPLSGIVCPPGGG